MGSYGLYMVSLLIFQIVLAHIWDQQYLKYCHDIGNKDIRIYSEVNNHKQETVLVKTNTKPDKLKTQGKERKT